MRVHVRYSLLALLAGALIAVAVPAAAAAAVTAPGIEKFVAANCNETHKECAQERHTVETAFGPQTFSEPKAPTTVGESKTEFYLQAGGHVPYGVTDFKVKTEGVLPAQAPEGVLKGENGGIVTHVRTDVAPGLATNPTAVAQCGGAEFGEAGKTLLEGGKELPGTHFFTAPTCSGETEIGINEATVFAGEAGDLALSGFVYNLVQPPGRASDYGAALKLPKPFTELLLEKEGSPYKGNALAKGQYYVHTLVEGNVEWAKEAAGTNAGDYHDYFEIEVSPELPLIASRLTFEGRRGGNFITNATSCPGNSTTTLHLRGTVGVTTPGSYTPLPGVGLEGCNSVPFAPTFSLTPATSAADEPDGISATVGLTRFPGAAETDSAQLKTAVFTLPEGMTLNPSAAAGLTACTPKEAHIHELPAGVGCASSSLLGTVSLEVPTLPAGSLKGNLYLGGPESGPITAPPYIVYVDAESARYGVSVRVRGEVTPNLATGQLTTTFAENPEQPFTNVKLQFKEGALAPIANPLTCGTATTQATFTPYTLTASKGLTSAFTPTGCSNPIPFAPGQSTANQTSNAGAATSFAFTLDRGDGQQYFSQVKTALPTGLVGAIPKVTLCGEAQANAGTCEAASQIGTASVLAGSGPTPYALPGSVYLTGPYNGAPYGLSIVVPEVAGPFNLGNVVTRAAINIDQSTARVSVSGTLPTITPGGVSTRLRKVSVSINKQGFLTNPTSCAAGATESTVTGTLGASVSLSSPFTVAKCSALKFKPAFKASTAAKTTKKFGASLETTVNEVAGQANIKSVLVQLPKQMPSRLATLHKACPEATFAANPYHCPSGSFVGGARANTPLLPSKMKGPAILVSHGGAEFPDLDLLLEGNGVRILLIGNTKITKGITTTNFATTPDVPVSSITVNLPIGGHSALAGYGNFCAQPLVMPTTITGQNGIVVKQNTLVNVGGCGVRIVGQKVVGNVAYITVQTYSAGRISGSGSGLATVYRHLAKAYRTATMKVPLARAGQRRGRPFKVRLRVGFVPTKRSVGNSASSVTLTFR